MPSNPPDSSKKLFQYIKDEIKINEPEKEVTSIAYYLLHELFGIDKAEVILDRSVNISGSQQKELNRFIDRLNQYEPIQYIVGEAEFYGRKFKVDSSTLIPRNETEELVQEIITSEKGNRIKFLDIGTGTGCIPITLAKELKETRAFACDIDPRVIKIAKHNAEKHNVDIDFMLMDILSEKIPLTNLDVIVSNPPYVRDSEKSQMSANVVDYEPEQALFVRDDDPLLYYRRIAELAQETLKPGGRLYVEINEAFGEDIQTLLEVMDYNDVLVLQDINSKNRIVKGTYLEALGPD